MEENVMKKGFVIFVSIVMLLGAVSASVVTSEKENPLDKRNISTTSLYEDELDQNQSEQIQDQFIPVGRVTVAEFTFFVQVAQSFIPTKEVLTRVELFIGKNSTTTYPYVVGIKDNLIHENLREITVPASEIITSNYSWVVFDFEDIWVIPGQTYFIVSSTTNATDNWYAWAANNQSEAYPNGCAWVSLDNGSSWNQSESYNSQHNNDVCPQRPVTLGADNDTGDMCFKTYGIEQTTLDIVFGGSIFASTIMIKNTGNETAWNIEWQYTVKGGILQMINATMNGTWPELAPGDSLPIKIGFLFGLGPISFTITARAVNAPEVSITKDALLLFIFILLK